MDFPEYYLPNRVPFTRIEGVYFLDTQSERRTMAKRIASLFLISFLGLSVCSGGSGSGGSTTSTPKFTAKSISLGYDSMRAVLRSGSILS